MLDGQFTRLRSVDLTDAEWMRRLRTSPVVMQAFQYRYPITDVQQEEFIRGLSANREQLYFVAEDPAGAKPFGVCCLHEIDYRNQRAECGIFWDADATGGEIAAFEAGFLLRDYAYSYLNLQKIVAEILSDNVRSIRFHEALGMMLEATRRRHLYYDGQFHDLSLYAQFRDDFYDRPTRVVQMFLAAKSRKQHPGL
ncbi:MAG TPA: GNAT family protein [Planctomycetaceae bacterium]|nr:GNAT family protein [Planctomycetaceae bacterium]